MVLRTDVDRDVELQQSAVDGLSPLRGLSIFLSLFLGLTPQAKDLSPLRGLMDWRPVLFHLGSRPRLRICRRFAA